MKGQQNRIELVTRPASTVQQQQGAGSGAKGPGGICRSRSAQSLKVQDMARGGVDQQDGDKTNILIQVFWICLAVLESDFEHEFLLGLRLLDRVLDRLPLDRPDVREKVEKLHVQVLRI